MRKPKNCIFRVSDYVKSDCRCQKRKVYLMLTLDVINNKSFWKVYVNSEA